MILFLYRLLIFLCVFDGIRSNSILSSFSFTKELIVIVLFTYSLLKYRKDGHSIFPKYYLIFLFLLLLYILSIGLVLTYLTLNDTLGYGNHESPSPFIVLFKTLESLSLVFIFYMFKTNTTKEIDTLLKFNIIVCLVFIFFNTVGYFSDLSFFLKKTQPWPGRISIGYPTSDAQILVFSLVSLKFLRINSILKFFIYIIFVLGIVLQSTATSMLSLIIIISWNFFSIRNIVWTIVIGIIFYLVFSNIIQIFEQEFPADTELFSALFELKMNSVLYEFFSTIGMESEANKYWIDKIDSSSEARSSQRSLTFSIYNSPIYLLFGAGTGLCTFVENQYILMLRAFGYFGLALYVIVIFLPIIYSFKFSKPNREILILSSICLILTNSSLISTYIFTVYLFYSMLIIYGFTLKRQHL